VADLADYESKVCLSSSKIETLLESLPRPVFFCPGPRRSCLHGGPPPTGPGGSAFPASARNPSRLCNRSSFWAGKASPKSFLAKAPGGIDVAVKILNRSSTTSRPPARASGARGGQGLSHPGLPGHPCFLGAKRARWSSPWSSRFHSARPAQECVRQENKPAFHRDDIWFFSQVARCAELPYTRAGHASRHQADNILLRGRLWQSWPTLGLARPGNQTWTQVSFAGRSFTAAGVFDGKTVMG